MRNSSNINGAIILFFLFYVVGNCFAQIKDENWENGIPKSRVSFDSACGAYKYITCYENGKIEQEWCFIDQGNEKDATSFTLQGIQKNGTFSLFYDNGQVQTRGHYEEGLKNGIWIVWYANGQKESEGKYLKDLKCGFWNEWYPNGKIKSQGEFKIFFTKKFIEGRRFTANGKSIEKAPKKRYMSKKNGEWLYYDEQGLLKKREFYKNEKLKTE